MKKTKKIVSLFIMLVLLMSLAACGNQAFTCDLCKEEKTGKSYKSQLMGEELTICEDCYEEMNEVFGY